MLAIVGKFILNEISELVKFVSCMNSYELCGKLWIECRYVCWSLKTVDAITIDKKTDFTTTGHDVYKLETEYLFIV